MLESATRDEHEHNATAEEEDDYTIYNNSPVGYEAMLKIRDDCDSLINNYNSSAYHHDGKPRSVTLETLELFKTLLFTFR